MHLTQILSNTLPYWPTTIDLTDTIIDEDGNPFSANLSMAWFEATDKFETSQKNDPWIDLMLWSMNKTLLKMADALRNQPNATITLKNINPEIFEADFKTVLTDCQNKILIAQYKGLN